MDLPCDPEDHVDELEGFDLGVVGPVGVIALDRPPVNALDAGMLARLADVFGQPARWFPEARSLALVTFGKHFSAGHDRTERAAVTDPGYLAEAADHLAQVLACPLPVVAGVDGAAIGTGFILACCADLLVVAPDASISLPEVTLGMLGGAGHAARWLPPALVRRMVLTGETVAGSELHGVGLQAPEPGQRASDRAVTVAAGLAVHDPRVLRAAREVVDGLSLDAATIHRDEMRRTTPPS